MTTKQQEEALNYFRENAGDWRTKAEGRVSAKVNVIEQRNNYVIQVASEHSSPRSFLDVGCGTGELVCDVASRGIESTGVDFAKEMIELATKKAGKQGLSKAKFVCTSIFDFKMPSGGFDVISANGLIEYINQQELLSLFDAVAKALASGGSFVVGSRNRLFNLVSMNEFTLKEMSAGASDLLTREAVAWTRAKNVEDGIAAEPAPLEAPETEHARTGIGVTQRFQYTPCQLIRLLGERGLKTVEVYPIHIHGVTPAFAKTNPEIHSLIADLLQANARKNTQLLSKASSFMLHVRKG